MTWRRGDTPERQPREMMFFFRGNYWAWGYSLLFFPIPQAQTCRPSANVQNCDLQCLNGVFLLIYVYGVVAIRIYDSGCMGGLSFDTLTMR